MTDEQLNTANLLKEEIITLETEVKQMIYSKAWLTRVALRRLLHMPEKKNLL